MAPGDSGVVKGCCPSITEPRRAQLGAYGPSAGRGAHVVQHAPVTVIRIDNTELTLEAEPAAVVLVDG